MRVSVPIKSDQHEHFDELNDLPNIFKLQHTISCGGGAGIFLVVTSTYIIVIRGRRACLWGSLYLDDFFEEDRDLK